MQKVGKDSKVPRVLKVVRDQRELKVVKEQLVLKEQQVHLTEDLKKILNPSNHHFKKFLI